MPQEVQTPPFRIRWNQVTWYSKLGAIIVFLGVVPALSFYVGQQYQSVYDLKKTIIITPQQAPKSQYNDAWTYGHYVRGVVDPDGEIGVEAAANNTLHITGFALHQQLHGFHLGDLDVMAKITSRSQNTVNATYGDADGCIINFLFRNYSPVNQASGITADERGVSIADTGDDNCGWGVNVRFHGDYWLSKDTPNQTRIELNKDVSGPVEQTP